jgi:branched-chain amino acid transport system substrate-binding protein
MKSFWATISKHPVSAIVAVVIAVLIPISCSKQQKEAIKKEAVKSAPLRIGVMLALTGDSANYGKRSLNGLTWAADKINQKKGGVNGKHLELVVEDDLSSPKDAVSAFNKLVSQDQVKVVIGDIISGTTLAVAPLAEKNHVLLFAPGASNPQLRYAGDYVFRNWTSDDFDGLAMAGYLARACPNRPSFRTEV